MATSGVYTLNTTAIDLVRFALLQVGAVEEEEALNAQQLRDGIYTLNQLIKSLQLDGIHRWRHKEGILFTNNMQERYLIGPTGDRTTTEDEFVATTLSANQVTAATTIDLTSTAGISVGDNIGIRITNQLRHWTNVSAVGATTVDIDSGLPADAISGATVFVYQNNVQRPLRITHGRRQSKIGLSQVPTFDMSRNDYNDLTTRGIAKGLMVQHQYEPILTNGELRLWPTPNNVDFLWRFTYINPLQIVVNNSDNLDFPDEFILALKWNLAAELIDENRNDLRERAYITAKADAYLDKAKAFDRSKAPIRFRPNMRRMG